MRNPILLTMLLFVAALAAKGQSCFSVTVSNGMSTYQGISTDGVNLSAYSVTSGADSMSTPPGCPPLNGSPQHTAYASATLTSNSGLSASQSNDYSSCYSCYLDVQATATLPIGSDTSWTLAYSGSTICSMAGMVFSKFGDWPITTRVATTYGTNFL